MDRTGSASGEKRYSLADLTDLADVSVRTVRYYIAEGLLPPPNGSGPASFYTPAHLERLQLIGRLKDAYLPLKEIRRRLAGVEDRELAGLLELSDAELFDPATWDGVGAPRTVTSYVERALREARASAPSGSAEPAAMPLPRFRRAGRLLRDDDGMPAAYVDVEEDADAPVTRLERPDVLAAERAISGSASLPPRQLQQVAGERGEIEREVGPAWRRLALGDEIELMVSDRAWRRNREKLEWLANWARKVLR